ncbi:MAG: cobalamin B12-binding domain-containing protein [Deltaproteobacteria bacterium]|uniref:cobalamin B12-binding domain-containing protein n=1 Tax=Desulfobacula sp. TaxID=2593537 RepID=UPI0019A35167|nr:cobalamin B12-binding domain-containing protein [Candidatus Desulfobacula maris]MBL6996170.1 cobalamin-dependent protein [Desulfobacula sp.]
MIDQFKRDYLEAILDTNRDLAFKTIDDLLDQGHSPEVAIFKILIPVMEELAEIVKVGPDATLAQLYLAAQISAELTDRLVPLFTKKTDIQGKIVIGTAFEDFHGLGKKIVKGCLKSKMIEVVDLGLNVPAEKFVAEAIKQNAQIIGISSMMVHTARGSNGPVKVRELLNKNGLEGRIQLVVGGAPYRFHSTLYREVGADAWADNGITAAMVIADLIRENKTS